MTKVVHCRDVGFDCDGVVRGESEEEVLQGVAAHAAEAHNLTTVTDEVIARVREVMRTEEK